MCMKKTIKNKLYALALLLVGAFSMFDGDATAFVLLLFFAVPLFFAKENWIM